MVGHVLGRDKGFLVATEFLVLCRDRVSLCRNMALMFHAIARSRHFFSMSRECFPSLS